MKCGGGHDGVQHRGLDCGDGERWEAVGMGADGSKGGGMEGALCLCRVVAAAAGPHRTGHWGSPPHLLRCPSLRCGVQATAGQGSGMFPSGWEIQTQPWPPRLTAVSRGASGADGQKLSAPWLTPTAAPLHKAGRRPVFPRTRSQEDSSWIQPQDPSQPSAII